MSNTIYVNKLIKNEISNMKNMRKEIISNLAKNLYDSKDKTLMREAVYILSKNIVIFRAACKFKSNQVTSFLL